MCFFTYFVGNSTFTPRGHTTIFDLMPHLLSDQRKGVGVGNQHFSRDSEQSYA